MAEFISLLALDRYLVYYDPKTNKIGVCKAIEFLLRVPHRCEYIGAL